MKVYFLICALLMPIVNMGMGGKRDSYLKNGRLCLVHCDNKKMNALAVPAGIHDIRVSSEKDIAKAVMEAHNDLVNHIHYEVSGLIPQLLQSLKRIWTIDDSLAIAIFCLYSKLEPDIADAAYGAACSKFDQDPPHPNKPTMPIYGLNALIEKLKQDSPFREKFPNIFK